MSKLILLLGLGFVLILAGFLYIDYERNNYAASFPTQAECESSTGKECAFSSCDYKCENSKYGYFKGYIPK